MAPLYTFTAENGATVDKFYHMADAPKFGSSVVDMGVAYVRKPGATAVRVTNTCVVAASLPRWDKRAAKHTKDGKPAFESKREIDEYQARAEKEWIWD